MKSGFFVLNGVLRSLAGQRTGFVFPNFKNVGYQYILTSGTELTCKDIMTKTALMYMIPFDAVMNDEVRTEIFQAGMSYYVTNVVYYISSGYIICMMTSLILCYDVTYLVL